MKRCTTILVLIPVLAVLVLLPDVGNAADYGWTLSASNSNPLVHTGPAASGILSVYLWLHCNTEDGWAAAEFDLSATGGLSVLGFTPMNGVLNAGTATALQMAVGGCPSGPFLAGEFTLFDPTGAGGELCLVESAANNYRVTVDCDPLNATIHPIDVVGFSTLGGGPSCADELCGTLPPADCEPELSVLGSGTFVYRDCPVDVDIAIADACSLGAFQFDMPYGDAVLSFDGAAMGPFLGSTGRTVTEVGPIDAGGAVSYGAISYGSQDGPEGSGILATLSFLNTNGSGAPVTEPLGLTDIEIVGTSGTIVPATGVGGDVSLLSYIYADFVTTCEITVADIMQVASRWGSSDGDPLYDPLYDINLVTPGEFCASNPDGEIDMIDVQLAASRWGVTCSASPSAHGPNTSNAQARFWLDPPVAVAPLGATVRVAVMAGAAQDLGAYELTLALDPEVVELVAVESGEFFELAGNHGMALSREIRDGTHRIGGFSFGHGEGAEGTGAVAYVDLRIVGCGDTELAVTRARAISKAGTEGQKPQATGGQVICGATGAPVTESGVLGLRVAPNPAGDQTTLAFDLGRGQDVRVSIYDVAGRHVRTVLDGGRAIGRHEVVWDTRDERGLRVPSGIYFVRMETERESQIRKIVIAH